jgi:hypothetical protein
MLLRRETEGDVGTNGLGDLDKISFDQEEQPALAFAGLQLF